MASRRGQALYQVDAFAGRVFAGNPATVCPLEAWPEDSVLQAVAAENNLSETAFFAAAGEGFDLRWFTPLAEVALCGHATLASAYVIFTILEPSRSAPVAFSTAKSGVLTVARNGELLSMDFPAVPAAPCTTPAALAQALGRAPTETYVAPRDYLAIFEDEAAVRALEPDIAALAGLDRDAVIASAPGEGSDFVSRFFAPRMGVAEDPVTGSSHCTLTPYWAARLGKLEMRALQVSSRGGELGCTLAGDRVHLAGRYALYLEGTISMQGEQTRRARQDD